MPTATPIRPLSAIGVSKQRSRPYFFCSPSVARKTPPKKPTSSPNTSTSGSRPSITSMAEFSAWIMFIRAMRLHPHLLALLSQVPGHLLEHVLEHRRHAGTRAAGEGAVALGLLAGRAHRLGELLFQRRVLVVRPRSQRHQVAREPRDRIAQRPSRRLLGRPVAAGIVAGRVALGPIGDQLDDRRAEVGAGPLRRQAVAA